MKLFIDIETQSNASLKDCSIYNYVEDESFRVVLFAYTFDSDEVQVVDFAAGELLPTRVLVALSDDSIKKYAYNAHFEYVCLRAAGYKTGTFRGWRCIMQQAHSMNFQGSLAQVGTALGIEKQKLESGKRLVKKFSKRTQVDLNDPDWKLYKEYCKRDVEAQREIYNKLFPHFKTTFSELEVMNLDFEINDRGVYVDVEFAQKAKALSERLINSALQEIQQIAQIANPQSVTQLAEWLKQRGYKGTLSKEDVKDNLKHIEDKEVRRVLELRQYVAKASVKKYESLLKVTCKDSRARGLLRYAGAFTGRWAGRYFQPQNLPRGSVDIDFINSVKSGSIYKIDYSYIHKLSEAIRACIVAPEGKLLIISDFSSIEARVLAWIAGEDWKLDVFKTHGKIYEATAAKMFNIDIVNISKGSPERLKGKIAELALGYGGGVNALKMFGKGLIEEAEMREIVASWRRANRNIVAFWHDLENVFRHVTIKHKSLKYKCLTIYRTGDFTVIKLPSGRRLYYPNARIEDGQLIYKKTVKTWGGKLAENVVSAIARDLLANAMLQLDNIVLHVHDEIVIEVRDDRLQQTVAKVKQVMSTAPRWAAGLPVACEVEVSKYYKK